MHSTDTPKNFGECIEAQIAADLEHAAAIGDLRRAQQRLESAQARLREANEELARARAEYEREKYGGR